MKEQNKSYIIENDELDLWQMRRGVRDGGRRQEREMKRSNKFQHIYQLLKRNLFIMYHTYTKNVKAEETWKLALSISDLHLQEHGKKESPSSNQEGDTLIFICLDSLIVRNKCVLLKPLTCKVVIEPSTDLDMDHGPSPTCFQCFII